MAPSINSILRKTIMPELAERVRKQEFEVRRTLVAELEAAERAPTPELEAALSAEAAARTKRDRLEVQLKEAREAYAIAISNRYGLDFGRSRRVLALQQQLAESADPRIQTMLRWLDTVRQTMRGMAVSPNTVPQLAALQAAGARVTNMRQEAIEDVGAALEQIRDEVMQTVGAAVTRSAPAFETITP